jgi:demethylmenaquinone methyltransferase/2-methoxy-6-polyprenyl-1,4-benzoquinol methylase
MNTEPISPGNRAALELFAPIATNYERWSAWLSMLQDPRWRARMVGGLDLAPGARVLDVAAGTGLITRLMQHDGHTVISLDLSAEMLAAARDRGAQAVRATAEALPFPDASFDALTFGYLLRYVSDPLAVMQEFSRVLKPGGAIGMVEFGRPRGVWRPLWWCYTRIGLPAAGTLAGPGWSSVGAFLGPSIDTFHDTFPSDALPALWQRAGFVDVRTASPSLRGGLLMWARRA